MHDVELTALALTRSTCGRMAFKSSSACMVLTLYSWARSWEGSI
jgi:hypothetical protein